MAIHCFWCIVKPLEDYILISKFLDVKCTHFQNKVHLEYIFSPKHILTQIIFYVPFVMITLKSTIKIINEINMDQLSYWYELSCAVIPFAGIITNTSTLFTNKNRFDLYYIITEILVFAKQSDLQLIKSSDLKVMNKYMKFMRTLLYFNPISLACIYYACFYSDNILIEIVIILGLYLASCLGFLAIILCMFYRICYYNMKYEVTKILYDCEQNLESEIKLNILGNILTKSRHLNNKAEVTFRTALTTVAFFLPIGIEIVLIYIQTSFLTSSNKQRNYIREAILIAGGSFGFILFSIALLQIEWLQLPVSSI